MHISPVQTHVLAPSTSSHRDSDTPIEVTDVVTWRDIRVRLSVDFSERPGIAATFPDRESCERYEEKLEKLKLCFNGFCERYITQLLLLLIESKNPNADRETLEKSYKGKEAEYMACVDSLDPAGELEGISCLKNKVEYFFEYIGTEEIIRVINVAVEKLGECVAAIRRLDDNSCAQTIDNLINRKCSSTLGRMRDVSESSEYIDMFGVVIVDCLKKQLSIHSVYEAIFYQSLCEDITSLSVNASLKRLYVVVDVFLQDAFNRYIGKELKYRVDVFNNQPGVLVFSDFQACVLYGLEQVLSKCHGCNQGFKPFINAVNGFCQLITAQYLADYDEIVELADLCASIRQSENLQQDGSERLTNEYCYQAVQRYQLAENSKEIIYQIVDWARKYRMELLLWDIPKTIHPQNRYAILINELTEYPDEQEVQDRLAATKREAIHQGRMVRARMIGTSLSRTVTVEPQESLASELQQDECALPMLDCLRYKEVKAGITSIKGIKPDRRPDKSEDRWSVEQIQFDVGGQVIAGVLSMVIDGHGCGRAEEHLRAHFASYLTAELKQRGSLTRVAVCNALRIAMVKMNLDYPGNGGATVSLLFQLGSRLFVGNLGDSVTAFLYRDKRVIQLSANEILCQDAVCQRITAYGADVIRRFDPENPNKKMKVIVRDAVKGSLSSCSMIMTSVFGDHLCCGVLTACLDIAMLDLSEMEEGELLGWMHVTDGVSEVSDVQEAGEWCISRLLNEEPVIDVSKSLVVQSRLSGSQDDITVMVCRLIDA